MVVNIYTSQTIRGPGKKSGAYCYILETFVKEKPVTITDKGILEPMSENKAELTILLKAFKRLRKDCEVCIYTDSQHIKTGINDWLEKWKQSNWRNAKGKEIANIQEWQQIYAYSEKYNIVMVNTETHSYRQWMKAEMEKKHEEKK